MCRLGGGRTLLSNDQWTHAVACWPGGTEGGLEDNKGAQVDVDGGPHSRREASSSFGLVWVAWVAWN